ncbi:chemosensory receptor C [Elysia marginata]|uniref:Chemosensory receptor C n=1 Tax=Elysia marginata TaxID=1093978 RepID=A0AAV4F1T4_9GAST|nr:chemosensory receptor C [Elysia marginata]
MWRGFSNLTGQTKQVGNITPEALVYGWMNLPFLQLYNYSLWVFSAASIPILIFGIAANILNIGVYIKTGVRNNVTVSFLALSTSDLVFLIIFSPHVFAKILFLLVDRRVGLPVIWIVDPGVLMYPFYWYAYVFYETSVLIVMYISVVRCACVLIPFKVKNTFTARRAVFTFITFFISAFLLHIPMFMKKRIVLEFDPVSNKTRLGYREMEDGGLAKTLNDIISRNILNWASILTTITCVIVLANKLQASARFRSGAATSSAPAIPRADADGLSGHTKSSSTQDVAKTTPNQDKKVKDKLTTSAKAYNVLQAADLTERVLDQLIIKRKFRYAGGVIRGSSGHLLRLSLEGRIEGWKGRGRP